MQDAGPEVRIASDRGFKDQFGRGTFYRNGAQGSKTYGIVAGGILVVIAIPIIIYGPAEESGLPRSQLGFSGEVAPSQEDRTYKFGTHDEVKQAISAADNRPPPSGQRTGGRKVRKQEYLGPQILSRPRNLHVPPGTMVKGVLVSGASNGPVKARLTESVTVNGETIIDEGAVLLGQGSSTEERLFIRFTKVVLRDGSSDTVQAQAADYDDKIVGLNGSKVSGIATSLAASVGLNFVTGLSEGMQESEVQNGVAIKRAGIKNALYNGTAKAATEESQTILSHAKNKPPLIEVPANQPLYILFDGE